MKLSCSVTRDLIPNYLERLTSEETAQSIKEHLENCGECEEVYRQMQADMQTEKVPEVEKMSKFLKKTKIMYVLAGILYGLGAIGILTVFIVDLAVNKQLTWSCIVIMEIVYAYSVIALLIWGGRNRILKALACASILLLPMLYILEAVLNKYFFSPAVNWFIGIALPVSVLWLCIIWVTVLFKYILKLNVLTAAGIFFALSGFGSWLTNTWSNQITLTQSLSNYICWLDLFSFISLGIILIVLGKVRQRSLNKKLIGKSYE